MATFNLKVVTPSRVVLDKEVERVIVRTANGDVGILKGHINYVAPLSIGAMKVLTSDQETKVAAIAGGIVKVDEKGTTILTNTCEWSDEIDIERAKKAEEKAKNYLENPTETHTVEVATLKLQRALNRINIVNNYK